MQDGDWPLGNGQGKLEVRVEIASASGVAGQGERRLASAVQRGMVDRGCGLGDEETLADFARADAVEAVALVPAWRKADRA